MAFTQTQVDELRDAIARGVLSVGHGDKRVQYRSLKEMRETLRLMEREIASATVKKVGRATFSRGH